MKKSHLSILVCPTCRGSLELYDAVQQHDELDSGQLVCPTCESTAEIVNRVPRFVPSHTYADAFGYQWNMHATTQHDHTSGQPISEKRFFNETRWPRYLTGERILEIGCGSGRFTTHALATGATVVSVDLSNAVDINYRLHSDNKKFLAIQADLLKLPLAEKSCDRVFCFGVLQHTPDVERAFKMLPRYLKSGGHLSVDVYDRCEGLARMVEPIYRTYYWFRPVTYRMPPERLYGWVQRYVNAMWPLSSRIARLPKLGRIVNRMMLIHDYRSRYTLSDEQLKQWAVLDTFDNLAPRFDQRQTLSTMKRWFAECDLANIDVKYGYNGIEGRATKC